MPWKVTGGVYKGHSTVACPHLLNLSFPRVHGTGASVWLVNDASVGDLEHTVVATEQLTFGQGCYWLASVREPSSGLNLALLGRVVCLKLTTPFTGPSAQVFCVEKLAGSSLLFFGASVPQRWPKTSSVFQGWGCRGPP